MSKDLNDKQSYLDNGIRVGLHHKQILDDISQNHIKQEQNLSEAIDGSEKLLLSLGYELPERQKSKPSQSEKLRPVISANGWEEVLAEAQKSIPGQVDFSLLLTESEINAVLKKHASIGSELNWFSSLDRFDFALSIATGVIAGVINVLLVDIPAHAGFLGGQRSEGGWLSNLMKEKTGRLFPDDKIAELEQTYSVSFDPSTNSKLQEKVAGLGPRTHRFQSLGHDPLIGFIFGVRDILVGEFSAIGKDGHLIIQQVADPLLQGEQMFIRILEAFKIQFGHLASDVATPAGLPAPLMPLLLFLQFGKIGNHSYTIADVSRQMYRSGYDFRHFMASSIPVMITEIIIRIGYFIRSIQIGKSLSDAIPLASSLKLRRQLLVAHSVALLINAGKVYITQNPLMVSWAQVLVFLRYVMPEVTFLLYGKESARYQMVEKEILKDYHSINDDIDVFLKTQDDFVLVV